MPLIIMLCMIKKDPWEKVLIVLNDVIYFYQQSISDLKHKGNLVSLQVQTAHFGIGVTAKKVGTSFEKKTA